VSYVDSYELGGLAEPLALLQLERSSVVLQYLDYDAEILEELRALSAVDQYVIDNNLGITVLDAAV
jgi:hypothetical protein